MIQLGDYLVKFTNKLLIHYSVVSTKKDNDNTPFFSLYKILAWTILQVINKNRRQKGFSGVAEMVCLNFLDGSPYLSLFGLLQQCEAQLDHQ